mgnify:CR=1 FL=1
MHEEERIIGVRCAQRLAEEAIFRLEAALRPDMTEKQASACFRKICMEIPGVEKALTDMVISGPNSAGYHNFSSDRVLGTGSLILIDFSIIVNGWYSDMTRMFSFGDPEDEARRICGIVAAAKAQAIAAAYPGVAASHLHMTAASRIAENGYGPFFPTASATASAVKCMRIPASTRRARPCLCPAAFSLLSREFTFPAGLGRGWKTCTT